MQAEYSIDRACELTVCLCQGLDRLRGMQVTFNKYAVPHMLSNYPGEEPYVRISALDQLVSRLLVSGQLPPLRQQGPLVMASVAPAAAGAGHVHGQVPS